MSRSAGLRVHITVMRLVVSALTAALENDQLALSYLIREYQEYLPSAFMFLALLTSDYLEKLEEESPDGLDARAYLRDWGLKVLAAEE